MTRSISTRIWQDPSDETSFGQSGRQVGRLGLGLDGSSLRIALTVAVGTDFLHCSGVNVVVLEMLSDWHGLGVGIAFEERVGGFIEGDCSGEGEEEGGEEGEISAFHGGWNGLVNWLMLDS